MQNMQSGKMLDFVIPFIYSGFIETSCTALCTRSFCHAGGRQFVLAIQNIYNLLLSNRL